MTALEKLRAAFRPASDDELREQIELLKAERRAFAREHDGRLREQRHARVDKVFREAQDEADRRLVKARGTSGPLALPTLVELEPFWRIAHDDDLRERLHAEVDQATDLSPLSLAEFEQRIAKLDGEIRKRTDELALREAERPKLEAEAVYQAVAQQVAARGD